MSWFTLLTWGWIGVAIITFLSLVITKIRAPYGRHTRQGWGLMIPNKWGWFWMELPALLICPSLALFGPRDKDLVTWILIGLWIFHYTNRTLIFPFRLKTDGKKMPISIVASAIFFNSVNGFINGYYLGFLAPSDPGIQINFIVGVVLFFTGWWINHTADSKLIALREQNVGYQIPRGWLFKYISCPNHFGEIIEWIGFAIAAWSLPAATFAVWTFANLAPRAFNHHEWYHQNFTDYPKDRKALFPFLI
ncbi:MAG: DUF1295 domain-containing protein [Bacteroidota bacterium]